MTCPGTNEIGWFEDKVKVITQGRNGTQPNSFIMEYKKKGLYRCKYKEENNQDRIYLFYVQGKGELKKKSQFLIICHPCQLSSPTSPLLCFDPQCVTTVMNWIRSCFWWPLLSTFWWRFVWCSSSTSAPRRKARQDSLTLPNVRMHSSRSTLYIYLKRSSDLLLRMRIVYSCSWGNSRKSYFSHF